ncbi:kinase-like domain-containing protein [Tricladium varicosporioides]|nr:kinase-like domain-containing protein [Hymenoscyphus varicosporioides]
MHCRPFTWNWFRRVRRSKGEKAQTRHNSRHGTPHDSLVTPRETTPAKHQGLSEEPPQDQHQDIQPTGQTRSQIHREHVIDPSDIFRPKIPDFLFTVEPKPPSTELIPFDQRSRPPPTEASDLGRLEIVSWNGNFGSNDLQQDGSQDFANIAFKIGDLFSDVPNIEDVDIGPRTLETLQDQLLNAQIEWPEGENKYFIPVDAIRKLVTVHSILVELRRFETDISEPGRLVRLSGFILATAPRLFAILVYIGETRSVWKFLKDGLDDTDLPLIRSAKSSQEEPSNQFTLCTSTYPNRSIASMETWSKKQIIAFDRDQWVMLAPVFKAPKEGKKLRHYNLDKNQVMPFIEDLELTNQAAGGFGSVWGVRIHPAHQFLYTGVNPENPNPLMALKKLHSQDRKDFNAEVEMLKNFRNYQNPHLVKLLATYSWRGHYYLVFPLASANLRQYWECKPSDFSLQTIFWVLRQCKGIASAIVAIHEFKPSGAKKHIDSTSGGLANLSPPPSRRGRQNSTSASISSSTPRDVETLYGRHGDIKPENILWSSENVSGKTGSFDDKGLLLLADFGLMAFHGKQTKSNVHPETITCSPSYAPPELSLRQTISRAYDIWSLGCVFLEFITWLMYGQDYLDWFPDMQDQTGLDGHGTDGTFFTILDHQSAIVRESVTELINDLLENDRCSEFVRDFLNLISNDMLVIDSFQRLTCGQLNDELAKMIIKAEANSEYLTKPVQLPLPKLNEATKQVRGILRGKSPMNPPPKPQEDSASSESHVHNSLGSLPSSSESRILASQLPLPQVLVTSPSTPSKASEMGS